jgi:DNA-binding MarR family transcriptional regulator
VLASALRLAVVRLHRRMRAQRADRLVTISQLAVLSTLDCRGPLTPGELATHEKVQPPSMTRVLAGLEGLGLVARRRHPTDGRQVIVQLTDAGTQWCRDEVRAREAWLSRRVAALDPEDQDVLRRAVEVINRLVESE